MLNCNLQVSKVKKVSRVKRELKEELVMMELGRRETKDSLDKMVFTIDHFIEKLCARCSDRQPKPD